ncbi:MAG: hypothetical protein KatS3mg105_4760 [Gemmatales bacterium]|nr:MAG: hypothetical protein KatS3mg105_4760 [Gemmatales bacterium]
MTPRIREMQTRPANLSCLDRFLDGSLNVLAAGEIAPHKNHERLLDAFAIYHCTYNRHSRLLIVGRHRRDCIMYLRAVRHRIRRWGLAEAVSLASNVSDEVWKSYYLCADLFFDTSRPAGISLPLLEAMSWKIPVLAVDSPGVRATVGASGLVWEDSDPESLAACLHRLACDEELRCQLGQMGWQRAQGFFRRRKTHGRLLHSVEVAQ